LIEETSKKNLVDDLHTKNDGAFGKVQLHEPLSPRFLFVNYFLH